MREAEAGESQVKASLVYRASSRTVVTQRNLVSRGGKGKEKENKLVHDERWGGDDLKFSIHSFVQLKNTLQRDLIIPTFLSLIIGNP